MNLIYLEKIKKFRADRYLQLIAISLFWYGWGLIYNGSQSYGAISDYNSYFKHSIEIFTNKGVLEGISTYTGAMNPLYFIVMGWFAHFFGSDLVVFQIFNIVITLPVFPAIYKLAIKHDFSDKSSFIIAISFILSYSLRASVLGINTDHFAFICMFWSYYFYSFNLLPLKLSSIGSILLAFLAFYTRQFYAPFLVFILYKNFHENRENGFRIFLLVFSLLLSLPELYLVTKWGSFLHPVSNSISELMKFPKILRIFWRP